MPVTPNTFSHSSDQKQNSTPTRMFRCPGCSQSENDDDKCESHTARVIREIDVICDLMWIDCQIREIFAIVAEISEKPGYLVMVVVLVEQEVRHFKILIHGTVY